ncbi:MAG: hypothetical protein MUE44_03640 [Oscillatoriaceae cyanobacterium Prado104]|jgi:hypothetical protein|nr:hypothetical protein [Oscillatoriaceae cyanobacterium Prado104]
MKKLEFLLQKEGDRAWLPLDTPDVEILEGKYRVVARIQHPNTDIEIRISYTSFEQVPPLRQVQSRSARTNSEGLVVIIPYTRLKPGKWELSCLPDAKSRSEQTWQYGIQLEVLPAEQENPAPLEPADSEAAPAEPESAIAPSETATAVAVAEPAPELQPTNIYQFPSPQTAQPKPNFNLQLMLDRDTFVVQLGRPLIISGKIDAAQTSQKPGRTPNPLPPAQAEALKKLIGEARLQVCLRDPQTSEILAQIDQPLPEQVPPCVFACVTYIPAECKSRLILGEAILNSAGVPLATQLFTLTARLERLLEVIEDNFTEQNKQREIYPTAPKPVIKKQPVNLSFLALTEKPSQIATPTNAPEPAKEVLPPQLNPRPAAERLELPSFGRQLPESSRSQLLSTITNSTQKPQVKTTASSIQLPGEIKPKEAELDALTPPSEPANSDVNDSSLPVESKLENSPEPETPPATKQAFQSLKVENRFWSRLSSLASTRESPEWLKETALPPTQKPVGSGTRALVSDSPIWPQQPTETGEAIATDLPETPESKEFVIFDEPPPPKKVKLRGVSPEVETVDLSPYVLPEDEAIPMPVLNLPRGEIQAGQRVKIAVRLPELMPRIYVKIWVFDRQTYLILDGPRWITDFAPSGIGSVEGSAELEIPYGCLEVEFEAIAVEMQTQRESHKVTVRRQILPPSGPILPLDD